MFFGASVTRSGRRFRSGEPVGRFFCRPAFCHLIVHTMIVGVAILQKAYRLQKVQLALRWFGLR
jgi:hypothetical protein